MQIKTVHSGETGKTHMTMWEMWLLRAVDELLITVTVHGEKVSVQDFLLLMN